MFDRHRIANNLARRPEPGNFVAELIADEIDQRLAPVKRRFDNALAIGPAADLLPAQSASADGPIAFAKATTALRANGCQHFDPDSEQDFAGRHDLVVSVLDLQAINDVVGYLVRLRRAMVPDGLLIAVALAGDSLAELRLAWVTADSACDGGAYARVAPTIDVANAGALLQRAGFAAPVVDIDRHLIRYRSGLALMREIKAFGAANPLADRPTRPIGKTRLAAALEAYENCAADADGRVRATLELVWMSGWVPHESQQKPLRPGSATHRLADFLDHSEKD